MHGHSYRNQPCALLQHTSVLHFEQCQVLRNDNGYTPCSSVPGAASSGTPSPTTPQPHSQVFYIAVLPCNSQAASTLASFHRLQVAAERGSWNAGLYTAKLDHRVLHRNNFKEVYISTTTPSVPMPTEATQGLRHHQGMRQRLRHETLAAPTPRDVVTTSAYQDYKVTTSAYHETMPPSMPTPTDATHRDFVTISAYGHEGHCHHQYLHKTTLCTTQGTLSLPQGTLSLPQGSLSPSVPTTTMPQGLASPSEPTATRPH